MSSGPSKPTQRVPCTLVGPSRPLARLALLVALASACAVDHEESFDPGIESAESDTQLVAGPDCTEADLCVTGPVRPQCAGALRDARFGFQAYQRFDVPRSGAYDFVRVALRRMFTTSSGALQVRVVEFAPGGPQDPAGATVVGAASLAGSLLPRTTQVVTLRFSPAITLGPANASTPRYALLFDVPSDRLAVGLGCTEAAGGDVVGEMGGRKLRIVGAVETPGAWRPSVRDLAVAIGFSGIVPGPCATTPGATCDDGNAESGDGCSATCQVEAGYICSGHPATCTAVVPAQGNELFTLPLSSDPALLVNYRLEGNGQDSRGAFHGTPENVSFGANHGRFGQGAAFVDNQTPRIRVGPQAAFNTPTYSIVGWLRSSANGVLLGNMLYGYPLGYGVDFDENLLYHRAGNAGFWTVVSAPYPRGQWIHVAATNNGTTMRLYINGVEVGTPTASPTISWSGVGVSMGDYYDTYTEVNAFTGDMDDVAVFSRALTPAEIATLAGLD